MRNIKDIKARAVKAMIGRSRMLQVDIYLNFGDDLIKHHKLALKPGSNVLDALRRTTEVELTPDDSVTGHCGAAATAIDGRRSDLKHFWLYYISDKDCPGWRIPMQMPDTLEVSDGMRIAWRYHDAADMGKAPRFGPRYTSRCTGGRCSRQF